MKSLIEMIFIVDNDEEGWNISVSKVISAEEDEKGVCYTCYDGTNYWNVYGKNLYKSNIFFTIYDALEYIKNKIEEELEKGKEADND